jgi:hypothetical protein
VRTVAQGSIVALENVEAPKRAYSSLQLGVILAYILFASQRQLSDDVPLHNLDSCKYEHPHNLTKCDNEQEYDAMGSRLG